MRDTGARRATVLGRCAPTRAPSRPTCKPDVHRFRSWLRRRHTRPRLSTLASFANDTKKGTHMKRTLLFLLIAVSTHANAVLVCGNDSYAERGQWYVGQSVDATLGQVDTFGDVWCFATADELSYI